MGLYRRRRCLLFLLSREGTSEVRDAAGEERRRRRKRAWQEKRRRRRKNKTKKKNLSLSIRPDWLAGWSVSTGWVATYWWKKKEQGEERGGKEK